MKEYDDHHDETKSIVRELLGDRYAIEVDPNSQISIYLDEHDDMVYLRESTAYYVEHIVPLPEEGPFQAEVRIACDWSEVTDDE